MDLTCNFGLEYQPAKATDNVLQLHLANCPDCQDQVSMI